MGDEDDSRGTLVVEVDGDGEALDAGYGAGEGDLLVRHHERRIPYGGGAVAASAPRTTTRRDRRDSAMGWGGGSGSLTGRTCANGCTTLGMHADSVLAAFSQVYRKKSIFLTLNIIIIREYVMLNKKFL